MSADSFPPSSSSNDLVALRDWFAGQALSGLIPMPRIPGVLPLSNDGMAKQAYAYADAMLRVRLEPPVEPPKARV